MKTFRVYRRLGIGVHQEIQADSQKEAEMLFNDQFSESFDSTFNNMDIDEYVFVTQYSVEETE